MGEVGGSRHYMGAGLGDVGLWRCPACGAENSGPLGEGCVACGSGAQAARRAEEAPPPLPQRPAPSEQPPRQQPDLATRWAIEHPDATLQQAFMAGYVEGVRDAQRQQLERERQRQPVLNAEGRMPRTIAAALALFRDQVLVSNPEEVRTGEWASVAEVNAVIQKLQEGEVYAVYA